MGLFSVKGNLGVAFFASILTTGVSKQHEQGCYYGPIQVEPSLTFFMNDKIVQGDFQVYH